MHQREESSDTHNSFLAYYLKGSKKHVTTTCAGQSAISHSCLVSFLEGFVWLVIRGCIGVQVYEYKFILTHTLF